MIEPVGPTWTGELFAGLHEQLMTLLRGLRAEDWRRQTSAGAWTVRDVTAHLLDVCARRLSGVRDGHRPPPPSAAPSDYAGLLAHIDRLNADWVEACRRLSTGVLVDLLDAVGARLADALASLDPHAEAPVAVAWAGETQSRMWLDIGREYTELWHHQDQIREAVIAAPLRQRTWLGPVLEISMWALPHAYRDVVTAREESVVLTAEGESGGSWTLRRDRGGWRLYAGVDPEPACRIRAEDLAMARILLHRYTAEKVRSEVRVEGSSELAEPFFRARAVMVRTRP